MHFTKIRVVLAFGALFGIAATCPQAQVASPVANALDRAVEPRSARAPVEHSSSLGIRLAQTEPAEDDDDAAAEEGAPEEPSGDPVSRDELFGTTNKDGEPKSRDALFGSAPAARERSTTRIEGFIDVLGAYSYDHPAHWSRAVARLQLAARGELSSSVKWKLGGRVDVDPLYAWSDFYPDRVKRDQRVDFFHGENYLDLTAGSWAFRLGAQHIVWGEVVGLFFADVVSARDMREFLLPTFDIIRIPQWAARAEYFAGDSHLEVVWIPVPTFDRIGKPGADFYPAGLPLPVSSDTAALFLDPERPEHSARNGNFGVRVNTLASGWDLAAFYYRSFNTQPTFYREARPGSDAGFVFAPRYDRIWQTGATVSKDLGSAVLRGEAVYTRGQRYAVNDPLVGDGTVARSSLDYIASLEFTYPGDTRINVQGFQRIYRGGSGDDIAVRADGPGASVYASTKITSRWEPQVLLIHNFRVGDSLIRPRLNWYPGRNVTVGFGADIFAGAHDGFFGRFGSRDRVYVETRLDF